MGDTKKKPIIGILGGICSGKSTVAAEFAKVGCNVIDADKIAHELLEKKDIKEKIIRLFGGSILDSEGRINHKRLANKVFSDAHKLSSLNNIIHPLVLQRAEELIKQYKGQSQVKAIILDMPLLVEAGWANRCDSIIFVDCKKKIRLERAKKMGFEEKEIKFRENFQISLDNKVSLADNIINNNSDFLALVRQIKKIFSKIMNNM